MVDYTANVSLVDNGNGWNISGTITPEGAPPPPPPPPPPPSSTYDYIVAATGSDSNPGTEASPFATIDHALSVAGSNSAIGVRGGTYLENIHRGVDSFITLKAYELEPAILDGSQGSDALYLNGLNGTLGPLDNFSLRDFIIQNAGNNNMKWEAPHGGGLFNCKILNAGSQGIYVHSSLGFKMIGNRFDKNGGDTPTNLNHAMYVAGSNMEVAYNLVLESRGYGLQMTTHPNDSSRNPTPDYGTSANLLCHHNTFWRQESRAGIVLWDNSGTIQNATVRDNLFVDNAHLTGGTQGVRGYNSANSGDIVQNNISYLGGTTYNFDNPVTEINNTVADPMFVDEVDFELQAGSPAIGAATDGSNIGAK